MQKKSLYCLVKLCHQEYTEWLILKQYIKGMLKILNNFYYHFVLRGIQHNDVRPSTQGTSIYCQSQLSIIDIKLFQLFVLPLSRKKKKMLGVMQDEVGELTLL